MLLDRALAARRSEHPVLLLEFVGDRLHMAEQRDRKPVISEETGHPNGVEVRAVGRFEHQRHIGPAVLGGDPVFDAVVMRFGFQEGVGPLGHAHARERRLGLLD